MSTHALESAAQPDDSKTVFGFWVYLMTDCVLFASLFAVFAVLRGNTFGGPSGQELFSLPYVLAETLILLTSSFTCGLAVLAARRQAKTQVLWWFAITFLLGAAFLTLALVGTHGLHISAGLLWMVVLIKQIWRRGLTSHTVRRLTLLSLFWHFLDVIWIFIFTIVYLMGAVPV